MRIVPSLSRIIGLGLVASVAPVLAAQAPPAERPFGDSVYRRMLDFKSLIKGGAIAPHWMADKKSFWYLEGAPDQTTFLKVDPAANTVAPVFDLPRLRGALAQVLGHQPPYQGIPFETFEFADQESAVLFNLENKRFRLELATYRLTPLGPAPPPAPAPDPRAAAGGLVTELAAPRGPWTAVIRDHDLALKSRDDGRTFPLTTDGEERFSWSLARAQWNKAGTHLLALKADQRNIHFMPVVHWLKPGHEEITWHPYAGAGEAAERSELWVVDAQSGARTRIETGDSVDQQIHPLGWRPDGSEVLFLRVDRLFKRVDLLAASAATGKSRVLLTERQDTFVEGLAFNSANLFYPLTDGSRFIWRSERDGWSHLYLYDAQGTLLRRLTSGEAPVERVEAIDETGGWVFYAAHGDRDRPYDEQIYRVDLEGKHTAKVTEATGVHTAVFAPGTEYFLATNSTVARAPVVELRKADGTLIRVLSKADIAALTGLGWRPPEEFKVKAADGKTDLYGAIYTPHDFNPSRKYPVIDLQYMGNFVHSVPRTFAGNWLGDDAQSLTQLGFVVYIVDARGTPGRGKAFQDFTYRNLGKIEVPDHVATLRQLAASRPYLDTTRVGITGFSWGGYFTIRALLTAPEVFKVGVSGAPVVDLLAHMAPIEAYMGTPQSNPDGYEQGSNVALASRLRGKLLITIGTSDVNVTFNHAMRLANAFIKAGKFFDLLVLPEETHGQTPAAQAYYIEARNRYFVEHLRPGGPALETGGREP